MNEFDIDELVPKADPFAEGASPKPSPSVSRETLLEEIMMEPTYSPPKPSPRPERWWRKPRTLFPATLAVFALAVAVPVGLALSNQPSSEIDDNARPRPLIDRAWNDHADGAEASFSPPGMSSPSFEIAFDVDPFADAPDDILEAARRVNAFYREFGPVCDQIWDETADAGFSEDDYMALEVDYQQCLDDNGYQDIAEDLQLVDNWLRAQEFKDAPQAVKDAVDRLDEYYQKCEHHFVEENTEEQHDDCFDEEYYEGVIKDEQTVNEWYREQEFKDAPQAVKDAAKLVDEYHESVYRNCGEIPSDEHEEGGDEEQAFESCIDEEVPAEILEAEGVLNDWYNEVENEGAPQEVSDAADRIEAVYTTCDQIYNASSEDASEQEWLEIEEAWEKCFEENRYDGFEEDEQLVQDWYFEQDYADAPDDIKAAAKRIDEFYRTYVDDCHEIFDDAESDLSEKEWVELDEEYESCVVENAYEGYEEDQKLMEDYWDNNDGVEGGYEYYPIGDG